MVAHLGCDRAHEAGLEARAPWVARRRSWERGRLSRGALDLRQAELAARLVTERVPFTEENAALAARLFNLAGHRQGTLADCMIAATAIRCAARLATTNRRDFAPLAAGGLGPAPG